MQCPNCHYQNRSRAKFCHKCGQALTPPAPIDSPSTQTRCANCGRSLRPGARFCGVCGTPQPLSPPLPQSPAIPASSSPQAAPSPLPPRSPASPPRPSLGYIIKHSLLSGLLAVGLLLALSSTFVLEQSGPDSGLVEPPPQLTPSTSSAPVPAPTADYRQAVVEIGYGDDGRFGLYTIGGDPATSSDDNKLLTFSEQGGTHNTRVWIDGDTPIYGDAGIWGFFGGGEFRETPDLVNGQVRSVWVSQDIEVAQTLSYVYGTSTGRVDTVQIKYVLTNKSNQTKEAGLRIMIDTLIGDNDGVPFVVPGREGITSQAIDLRGAEVPDFIQALEFPDLTEPGVIVHLTLQGADATRPDRVIISAWCDGNAEWDYYESLGGDGHPLRRCGGSSSTPDSAVGLYFDPQPLPASESRTIITYYGLGGISSTATQNVRLSLTFNRTVHQGDTFWVTALITEPQAGQSVRLDLPAGLSLTSGYEAEQVVTPGGEYTQVSWQVVANSPLSDGLVTVTLQPDTVTESQSITVQARGITR